MTYPGAARVSSSDMTRFHGLLTAALLGALVGCDASGLGGPRERTLLVQDHAVECTGVSLQLCLLVKDPSTQQFTYYYGAIEGFVYEWGFIYEIDVEERAVANPLADGSSIQTVLRRVVSKQRVPPGTEFDLVLTAGNARVVEVAPDHYRFYATAEFICSGATCAELRAQIAAGTRIRYRFAHPITASDPLTVVQWEVCQAAPGGSDTCSS